MAAKTVKVRTATPQDLPEIMKIYAHAREFMAQAGNPTQWGDGYPRQTMLEDDIARGNLYVGVADGGALTCSFYFAVEDDATYQVIEDGAWLNDEPYGVIHRIAAAPETTGAATFALHWALARVGNIRIDTHADNAPMRAFLAKNGFAECGRIYTYDGSPRVAYQLVAPRDAALLDALIAACPEGAVRACVPMLTLTTFRIGGPADIVVDPSSVDEVCAVIKACNAASAPWRVIGCGSDLLISDEGLRCVVIRIAKLMSDVRVEGSTIFAQAGATNKKVAETACAAGLAGYEFASGIPGTVGGAAIMNAGAYDGEFVQVATQVECVTPEGERITLSAAECDWSYRHSAIDERGLVVVEATLSLTPDNPQAIRARIDDLEERRASKQPLDMPSAGSTFKRPEGYFVGKLVQDAGLRGFTVGGAQVSEKHTGFVVNAGGATAADVRDLISQVQACILEKDGVALEPEVRMWGFGD